MAEYTHVGPGLPPLHGDHARVLILGSFPSPKSREQGFYYGHPQNRFWPMMAALTGSPVPEHDDIPAKRQMIIQNGLAIWDVIRSCDIIGASDASIRNVEPNALADLIARLGVERVVCNGSTSARLYRKYAQTSTGLDCVGLPSTSPANASFRLFRLQEVWGQALGPYLPVRL